MHYYYYYYQKYAAWPWTPIMGPGLEYIILPVRPCPCSSLLNATGTVWHLLSPPLELEELSVQTTGMSLLSSYDLVCYINLSIIIIIIIAPSPLWEWSIVMTLPVRRSVCPSVIISLELPLWSLPFFVHITYDCGSVLLCQRCDTLCTSICTYCPSIYSCEWRARSMRLK